MLHPVLKPGSLHFDVKPDRCISRAGAAIVNGAGVRIKHHLPSSLVEPLAPVYVLTVNEKPFVEQADVLQRGPSQKPETSVDNVDAPSTVMIPEGQQLTATQLRSREHDIQRQRTREHVPQ